MKVALHVAISLMENGVLGAILSNKVNAMHDMALLMLNFDFCVFLTRLVL